MSALYTDGDGRWHSQYIAMTKNMSLDSLLYVMQDCAAAIAAVSYTHLTLPTILRV